MAACELLFDVAVNRKYAFVLLQLGNWLSSNCLHPTLQNIYLRYSKEDDKTRPMIFYVSVAFLHLGLLLFPMGRPADFVLREHDNVRRDREPAFMWRLWRTHMAGQTA